MKKSIDIAAAKFVSCHKADAFEIDHTEGDYYGSVAGYLTLEGEPTGELGRMHISIRPDKHKDGLHETVEWYEDTYQIAHYRLPFADRITPEDHTPEINFDPDFYICIDRIKELRAKGYCDIAFDEVVEGAVVDSIDIADYIDGWEVQS